MPGRLRQPGAVEAAEAAGRKDRLYDIPGLEFNDALTWRAGKTIPVADLLSRLQKLSGELRNFDQDQVESGAFTQVAHDLANTNLLGHKDKGVRAWTVSCIVDILKICAPNAPFLDKQLKVRNAVRPRALRLTHTDRTSSPSSSTRFSPPWQIRRMRIMPSMCTSCTLSPSPKAFSC